MLTSLVSSIQPEDQTPDEGIASLPDKQIISLNIPLNDTGSAGLGVSVKGKTSTTASGSTDLGIFIKSVIKGGAASKVRDKPMLC